MARKSALGNMVQQALLPPIQQMQQQGVQAIMQAIQGIRMPEQEGIDPMMLQQIGQAIQSIPQPDMTPLVAIMANLSEQIDSIPVTPTEWVFDVKRDKVSKLIESVEVRPA